MMDDDHAAAAFGALAHTDRIRALRLLIEAGPSGLASGGLAERMAIPATRMSFHLTTLERAGLVHSWRVGRSIRYAPQIAALRQLLAYLTADCCGGRPEICGDLVELARLECPETRK